MTIRLPKDVQTSIEAAVQSRDFASADDAVAAAWRAFEQIKRGGKAPKKKSPKAPVTAHHGGRLR